MPKVFISHTHSDKQIADAINDAIGNLFGKKVIDVVYSTKKEEGGIQHGADWFDWIVDQVIEADVALILLTPGSIQKPWILWEAGAVEGVAMASQRTSNDEKVRKVRPLVFNLKPLDIPSPFHRIQAVRGDKQEDVIQFLKDLIAQFKDRLDNPFEAGMRLQPTVNEYMERILSAMLRAPLMVSEAAVQEWLQRLNDFESRPSEVEQLHNWINVAFGRGDEDKDRPFDLRIHRRLADLYAKIGTTGFRRRAARELELARQLSPRDIFILRQQGNIYIAIEEFNEAWQIIEEIETLDPDAYKRNAECAALRGKYFRKTNNPKEAVKVYANALMNNPDSYYLANLAAEASIEVGETEDALSYYTQSIEIIKGLGEVNIWTLASAANACLANDDDKLAKIYVKKIASAEPSSAELKSIEGGLRLVQRKFNRSNELFALLIDILRGRKHP